MVNEPFKHLKFRLPTIETLNAMKMEKNFIAMEKGYHRQPYKDPAQTLDFWLTRINDEREELKDAVNRLQDQLRLNMPKHNILSAVTSVKEELADISNIVDYVYEYVTRIELENLVIEIS